MENFRYVPSNQNQNLGLHNSITPKKTKPHLIPNPTHRNPPKTLKNVAPPSQQQPLHPPPHLPPTTQPYRNAPNTSTKPALTAKKPISLATPPALANAASTSVAKTASTSNTNGGEGRRMLLMRRPGEEGRRLGGRRMMERGVGRGGGLRSVMRRDQRVVVNLYSFFRIFQKSHNPPQHPPSQQNPFPHHHNNTQSDPLPPSRWESKQPSKQG